MSFQIHARGKTGIPEINCVFVKDHLYFDTTSIIDLTFRIIWLVIILRSDYPTKVQFNMILLVFVARVLHTDLHVQQINQTGPI